MQSHSIHKTGLATLLLSIITFFYANAQTITGTVSERVNSQTAPLVGVNIYWAGTTVSTTSDAEGKFEIARPNDTHQLVFSFVGFQADTIAVTDQTALNVVLTSQNTLQEVTVQGASSQIDRISPIQNEIITTRTLAKAACCNLSESFETNASVNVSYSDAVTGAKQIQMLGLSGNYVQTNVENIPTIRGLASTFGLNFIPGTWISAIDIGKGAGSVVNGYESMSGAMNVELQKPDAQERVLANAYVNSFGRVEGNLNLSKPLTEKWSVGFLGHASTLQNRIDQNGDNFLDLPLYNQYNGIIRAKYGTERFMTQFGVKALHEDRTGGQATESRSSGPTYRFTNTTKRLEAFSKTARLYPEKPYRGLGLILNAVHHEQNSVFGFTPYDGRQQSLYGNLIYQSIIDNTAHSFKLGASYLLDDYREKYRDTLMTRTESVPGVFGEYTYKYLDKLTLVAGARLDFHNLFGTQFTPRIHAKYDLNPNLTLRASAGRGFRTPNALAENYGYLVSSRTVYFDGKPQAEVSWNYGTSLAQEFMLFGQRASLVLDYYRTNFQNQLIADLEHPRELHFYYLSSQSAPGVKARSFSNSFQAELNYQPIKRMEVKLAYRLFDVRQSMGMTFGESLLLPRMMVSRDRVLFNAGYALPYDKWKFDFTVQWNGPRRIPYLREGYEHTGYQNMPRENAPGFYNINAQVSKSFRLWEVYLGGENLGNFRQANPIVGANDPFGRDFDAAARVWGPITGRMIYAGFRYKLKI
ncbi:TonB-dependent receptor domain-containing protein [Larkinella insperata]|uniref:TonB-dependent receptor domain-containing protein n=1 Tax=Larkinella insperata TaxID=332158 RepID=A0ABW3QFR6_9BACT|nr:TonB-dependent receptor [Larkinella insperata]